MRNGNATLRGLGQLTWLEIKIFLREPLGAFGAVVVPVLAFIIAGRMLGRGMTGAGVSAPDGISPGRMDFVRVGLPVLAALLISINAVLSLVTIIAIYREGGILKRLRATPLRPHTILTAHVLVKLALTAVTLLALILAGKRYYPVGVHAPLAAFGLALLISTLSILSLGFLIASIVPTARFAQPIGAICLYPMVALSGLFVPLDVMSPTVRTIARCLPLTYVVSLLQGIWTGDAWSAHLGDIGALALVFVACIALSARVFRWE